MIHKNYSTRLNISREFNTNPVKDKFEKNISKLNECNINLKRLKRQFIQNLHPNLHSILLKIYGLSISFNCRYI